jgi:hypothetical protein
LPSEEKAKEILDFAKKIESIFKEEIPFELPSPNAHQ